VILFRQCQDVVFERIHFESKSELAVLRFYVVIFSYSRRLMGSYFKIGPNVAVK
jgi:hypothetical protein